MPIEQFFEGLKKHYLEERDKRRNEAADLLESGASLLRGGGQIDTGSFTVQFQEKIREAEKTESLVSILEEHKNALIDEFTQRGISLPPQEFLANLAMSLTQERVAIRIVRAVEQAEEEEIIQEARELAKELPPHLLIRSLELKRVAQELGSSGTWNLRIGDMETVGELGEKADQELLDIKSFKLKNLLTLKQALKRKAKLWQKFQAGEIAQEELGRWEFVPESKSTPESLIEIKGGIGAGISLTLEQYEVSVIELNLSTRIRNALMEGASRIYNYWTKKRSSIESEWRPVVGKLMEMTEGEILFITNFGPKALDELKTKLIEKGFLPRPEEKTP